jgi:hypothetical protein
LVDIVDANFHNMSCQESAALASPKEKPISNVFLSHKDSETSWEGVSFGRHFICYDGSYQAIQESNPAIFSEEMCDSLKRSGYKCRLASPDKLSDHSDKGYKLIYLTDKKNFRQEIRRSNQILMARKLGHVDIHLPLTLIPT